MDKDSSENVGIAAFTSVKFLNYKYYFECCWNTEERIFLN